MRGGSEAEEEPELELANLPSSANEPKDQAIWVKWCNDFYLSTRDPNTSGFETVDFSYVVRPKYYKMRVQDLSPFYMEVSFLLLNINNYYQFKNEDTCSS